MEKSIGITSEIIDTLDDVIEKINLQYEEVAFNLEKYLKSLFLGLKVSLKPGGLEEVVRKIKQKSVYERGEVDSMFVDGNDLISTFIPKPEFKFILIGNKPYTFSRVKLFNTRTFFNIALYSSSAMIGYSYIPINKKSYDLTKSSSTYRIEGHYHPPNGYKSETLSPEDRDLVSRNEMHFLAYTQNSGTSYKIFKKLESDNIVDIQYFIISGKKSKQKPSVEVSIDQKGDPGMIYKKVKYYETRVLFV